MAQGGRPRDPRVGRAILQAAVPLYGEVGWAGFSFDVLSRRSKVGKPAIYRRWDSKAELIVEAVTSTRPALITPDLGDLERELYDIAEQLFDVWTSDVGPAWTRLQVEQRSVPELGDYYRAKTIEPLESSLRGALLRARERREMAQNVSTRLVLSTIAGSIMARVLNTPVSETPELVRTRDQFLHGLVQLVLPGVAHRPQDASALGSAAVP